MVLKIANTKKKRRENAHVSIDGLQLLDQGIQEHGTTEDHLESETTRCIIFSLLSDG